MKIVRRVAAGCALMALALAGPAWAGCWSPAEREAAQVRELQTMLMVASLRCSAAGIDILPDYNGFVRSARTSLEGANLRIKTHFANEGGSQVDYDHFTTLLANGYGAGQTNPAACAEAAETARGAAATVELVRFAAAHLFPRALPQDGCAAAPQPAAPLEVAAAAPTPALTPLPEEVVAAMAVLEKYRATLAAGQPAAAPTQIAMVQ